MIPNQAGVQGQQQLAEKRRSFLDHWKIPGKHSESVIKLEQFIQKHYSSDDDDYVKNRFLVAVKELDDSEHVNSKQYDILQRALIVLSALTSFFVALEALVNSPITLKLIALLLSLLVGILGNYLTSFNIQAKRGAYRQIRELLISEIYKFHEGIGDYVPSTSQSDNSNTPDENLKHRRLFVNKVEAIIAMANENWGKLHQAGQPSQLDQASQPNRPNQAG